MADQAKLAPQARVMMQNAFDRLRDNMTDNDAAVLQTMQLQDVENAARELEDNLAAKGEMPNMRRLKPLFQGFRWYESASELMCKDIPLLPWIWAPLKPILKLAAADAAVLNQLLGAYKRIGLKFPNSDLSSDLKGHPDCQQAMAAMYGDVLEFHTWAYCMLRRRGWTLLFSPAWERFDRRLRLILDDLSVHGELAGQERIASRLNKALEDRERRQSETDKEDEKKSIIERQNARTWLEASKLDQEHELYDLVSRCHQGSCDWIYDNPKIKHWLQQGSDHSVLWLKGKPGSGKSVLCSKLIEKFLSSRDTTILYFFCAETQPESKHCRSLLRALVRQLIQKSPDLCAMIQSSYVNNGLQPSVPQLKQLLPNLLSTFPSVRIIVDGLDECDDKEQNLILIELLALAGLKSLSTSCKVLISSQDLLTISRRLRTRSSIDLSQERVAIESAISSFVHDTISQSPFLGDTEIIDKKIIDRIEQTLLTKADGMFLWVRLVVSMLENAYTVEKMLRALEEIPRGLEDVYNKIFLRFKTLNDNSNREIGSRIFQWLAYCSRPLKRYEVQDAVSLHCGNTIINESTRVLDNVFELCKPLIENGAGDTVRFVHISVKELSPPLTARRPGLSPDLEPSYLLNHQPLFSPEIALFNVTFSCVAYLGSSVTLIDDDYDQQSRLIEVAMGFHGLCRYASKHWVEHLLDYLHITKQPKDPELRQRVIQAVDGLASSITQIVPLERQMLPPMKSIDDRCDTIKGHEPLFTLVTSTLVSHLQEKIAPRKGKNPAAVDHPFVKIRRTYEEITKKLLQADNIPGLDEKILLSFKRIYGSSVLICRFNDCIHGLSGFKTSEERDEHEATHLLDLRCPHSRCLYNRAGGFRSAKRLSQHIEEYHATEEEPIRWPGSAQPSGIYRVATDATLVESTADGSELKDGSKELSILDEEDEEGEEGEEEEASNYEKVEHAVLSDQFALGTTNWIE